MHFKNMRIGMRLGIGFGIMMVLSVSLRFGYQEHAFHQYGMGNHRQRKQRTDKCARDAMKAIDKTAEGILLTDP